MLNISDKINLYINYQNEDLWKELKSEYNIDLFYNNFETSWYVEINGKVVKIVSNEKKINIPAFTHELLHLKVEKLGMTSFKELQNYTLTSQIFGNLIFTRLIYRTYNFHCHKKMYPFFNQMGFDDYDFVGEKAKFSLFNAFIVWFYKKFKYLKGIGIEQFLGNFFALKNDFVKSDSKKVHRRLKRLKWIDKDLYKIAEMFDDDWSQREDYNYLTSLDLFSQNLREYLVKTYSKK